MNGRRGKRKRKRQRHNWDSRWEVEEVSSTSPLFFDASIRIGALNVQRMDDEKRASPSCRSQKWRMAYAAEERVTMRQTAQRSSREFSSTRAALNSTSSEMASRLQRDLDGSRMGEVRQTMRMRFHVPLSH